ncbi:hypothetical protein HGP28_04575 [Vibrio sp. SM6]|uniref:Glutathione S-transferase n=1 Tax=Vibrio agarilyticus TaxID=2726741 RepID=A0A7X8TP22_9VIBR|nr:MAPEG family protein [Vibrio agarilyticus]NLS12169.1 hypothetical protein [Vibrio agarilyticus]
MVTALYASLLALLMLALSVLVIRQRRQARVAHADGGVEALKVARSAHSNAVDYIPITVILMALAELNGSPTVFIHLFANVFLLGRVLHAFAIYRHSITGRVWGMALTFVAMLCLVGLNLWYLPGRIVV